MKSFLLIGFIILFYVILQYADNVFWNFLVANQLHDSYGDGLYFFHPDQFIIYCAFISWSDTLVNYIYKKYLH